MGPFVATGLPDTGIAPGAFGGRFNAQVNVAAELPLREVKLQKRMPSGPKSSEEVAELEQQLQMGSIAREELQEGWVSATEAAEEEGSTIRLIVLNKGLAALAP